MVLQRINEAKVTQSDNDLAAQLKQDSFLSNLRDTTILNIIRVFRKNETKEANAQNILDWIKSFGTFGNFVLTFPEDLSTYSISDFAENEDKLKEAIKAYLRDLKIINDQDEDLTTNFDSAEKGRRRKLDLLTMCVILFNYRSEAKDDESGDKDANKVVGYADNGDAIYNIAAKDLKDNVKYDREKFLDTIDDLEDFYNKANESLKEDVDINAELTSVDNEATTDTPSSDTIQTVETNAFNDLINNSIQAQWEMISKLNSIVATVEYDYKGDNKDDILTIINQLIDDNTINVGMLHKVSELISGKTTTLINAGEEKAEEVISEPASDLE